MEPPGKPIGFITILLVSSDYREKRLAAATKTENSIREYGFTPERKSRSHQ